MPAASASPRRLHVPFLREGALTLDDTQAHHARHVLRLPDGAVVELFDDAGNTAASVIRYPDERQAVVAVEIIQRPSAVRLTWSIASAVPKAERADWLVEKLSELGAARWIPLAAERSVVLPTGAGKRQRWLRIATESAKQSRRTGVMTIAELTPLPAAISAVTGTGWVLSTALGATPIAKMLTALPPPSAALPEMTFFIGPEGGWTDSELRHFAQVGIGAVHLGGTILRVETAAIAAAAIVAGFTG